MLEAGAEARECQVVAETTYHACSGYIVAKAIETGVMKYLLMMYESSYQAEI